MFKRFKVTYVNSDVRFVLANTMKEALEYVLRKDVRPSSSMYGDVSAYGDVLSIELWDSGALCGRTYPFEELVND